MSAPAAVGSGLTLVSLLVAAPAFADHHEEPAPRIEEVVVTATKRETALSDLPEAVFAADGTTLSDNGTIDIEDFIRTVPGVTWESAGRHNSEISIRGVNQFFGQGVNTGFYFDEAPLGSVGTNPAFTTYDIARVEILRGPQGTLYGEGSLGGTVRYISNRPNPGEFEGTLHLGWGDIDQGGSRTDVAGVLNLPLVEDVLAIRLLGFNRDEGGYIDSDFFGTEDINNFKNTGGRVSLRWQPNDRLDITAGYSTARQESDDLFARAFSDSLSFNAKILQPFEDEYDLYTLELNYEANAGNLTAATTYFDRDQHFTFDQSLRLRFFPFNPFLGGAFFPPSPPFPPPPASFPIPPVQALGTQGNLAPEIFSQEVRFASSGSGPLTWIGGFFFKDYKLDILSNDFTYPALTQTQLDDIEAATALYFGLQGEIGENGINRSDLSAQYQTIALFGELTYQFTDRLRGLLGVRLFEEDRDVNSFQSGLSPMLATVFARELPVFDIVLRSRNSDEVSNFKLSLAYDLSNTAMIYAIAAEGFKGGGENTNASLVPGAPQSFGPETLTSYEFGWKASFWNNRAYIDGSAYYIDWQDIVAGVDAVGGGTSISVVDNVGAAASRGVDLSVMFGLTDNWTLSINGGVVNAKLEDEFLLSGGQVVPEGSQLPDTPEHQFNVSTSYDFPIGSASVRLNANFNRVGSAARNLDPTNQVDHEPYETLNVGASVQLNGWRIGAYVDNATNNLQRQIWAAPGTLFGPSAVYNVDRPRTTGLRVRYDF